MHHSNCDCASAATEAASAGTQSLLLCIDQDGIRAMNEETHDSVKGIFKPFNERHDGRFCRSPDGDTELLIHIPFANPCKITGVRVIPGVQGTCPEELLLYSNVEGLDFELAEQIRPTDKLGVAAENLCGTRDYPLKSVKFNNVYSLDIVIRNSQGADYVQLHYVDIRGVPSKAQQRAVQTVYEARANLADHEVPSDMKINSNLGC